MALVYSLCWDGNGVVPRPPDVPTNNLADLLKEMNEAVPHPSMLAWGLDHQYSNNSLVHKGAEALKGSDKLIYSSLQGANNLLAEDKKLEFIIVEATKLDNFYGECMFECSSGWKRKNHSKCFNHYDEREVEYEFSVIGVDGKSWKTSRQFFDLQLDNDVLNVGKDDASFWGTCHHGKCSGPSGNEGATKTNWYRRYILVIITKESAEKAVFKSCLNNTINYLEQQVNKNGASSMKDQVCEVVKRCVDRKDQFLSNTNSVTTLLKVLTKVKDLELTKTVLTTLTSKFRNNKYAFLPFLQTDSYFGICSDGVAKRLAEVVSVCGWKTVEDVMRKMIVATPQRQYHHVITFIARCHNSVPKDALFNYITEAISKQYNNREQLSSLGEAVLQSRKQCPRFVDLFFEFPAAQNLAVMADIVTHFQKKEMKVKDIKNHRYYKLACSKMLEQLEKIPEDGRISSENDIDAIVKATLFFHKVHDHDNMLKLVNGVVPKASHNLMKKLTESLSNTQPLSPSKAVKIAFEARIAHLKPIVEAGVHAISFRKPHACIPGHPEVEEFLKGPDVTFKYTNFEFKDEAQSFKHKYFIGQGLANVRIECARGEVGVVITKTPTSGKKLHKEFEKDRAELKRLESILEGL